MEQSGNGGGGGGNGGGGGGQSSSDFVSLRDASEVVMELCF